MDGKPFHALIHDNPELEALMATTQIRNALTIDVEDYFQVSAFASHISRDSWSSLPCRVEANVDRILSLLGEANIKATFFTLGWIAERYPAMVRRIADDGHEIASHGYAHQRASEQTAEQFNDDVACSKALLEDICGRPVLGYRAPSFSIGKQNLWTHNVLMQAGYHYSSSIYPIQHDHYGMPDASRFAFYPNGKNGVLELPITTARVMDKNLPAGGGGYFRFFPYAMSRWLMQRVNEQDQQPTIFYFHPWELDPGQPRQKNISMKTRFRHYLNLSDMERRLQALTRDFKWGRVDQVFLENQWKH
jgi:polysaccharide deacetylase family protein (PEP-CTERM system associated)